MTTPNAETGAEAVTPPATRILCAVSGGADSVYMLRRLCDGTLKVTGATQAQLIVAHYNHLLRGRESDRDEAFTRELAQSLSLPFYRGEGDVFAYALRERLGIEEAARRLRYDFLLRTAAETGCGCVATAHTADDNLETMLLNLCRGSGTRGLAGIPPTRELSGLDAAADRERERVTAANAQRIRVIRPILRVTRSEIEAYLLSPGTPRIGGEAYVTDSSNHSDDYARNRLRRHAIPILTAINPAVATSALRLSERLRDDDDYLASLATEFIAEHVTFDGDVMSLSASRLSALPGPVAGRVVKALCGNAAEYVHVAAVLGLCAKNNASVDIPGLIAVKSGNTITISPRDGYSAAGCGKSAVRAVRFAPVTLIIGGETRIPELGAAVRAEVISYFDDVNNKFNNLCFQNQNICDNITVSAYEGGAKLRPAGRNITKTLKNLMQENKIPPREREGALVFSDASGILAVRAGKLFALDERAVPTPGRPAICIEVTP